MGNGDREGDIVDGVGMGFSIVVAVDRVGVTSGVRVGSGGRIGVGIAVGCDVSSVKVQLYVDVKPALLLN